MLTVFAVLGKILLWLFLVLLLFLVLVLISRIGVRVRIQTGKPRIVWGYIGFFRVNLTRFAARKAHLSSGKPKLLRYTRDYGVFGEEGPQESASPKAQKTKNAHKGGTTSPKRPQNEHRDILTLLERLTQALADILSILGRDARLRVRRLVLTAAACEAADTALMFAAFNTALGSFWSLCERFRQFTFSKGGLGVYSDFCADTPRIELDVQLSFRGYVLVKVGVKALQAYWQTLGKEKAEKTQEKEA